MIVLNSVLVAFDFSETSMSALTYGENLARTLGGRLHVLRRDVRRARAERSPQLFCRQRLDRARHAERRSEVIA